MRISLKKFLLHRRNPHLFANPAMLAKQLPHRLKKMKIKHGMDLENFNNIPVNPDQELTDKPKLSPEELLREKFKALRKLEELERKGVKLSKRYSMESNLEEMQGEYEMIIDEKERSNSCKFQGRMLMAAVTGIEFLNNRFDPFDIKA